MRILLAIAGSAAMILGAAPAQADPGPDANFLASLKNDGISFRSDTQAISAAHQVCDWMDGGEKRSDVIKTVQSGNPGFTMEGAANFTTLAERAYCPGGKKLPPTPTA